MVEILGGHLKMFMDLMDENCEDTKITYAGDQYEVWQVSDYLFQRMCDMSEEKFVEIAGKDAWWRSAEGSVMGVPDMKTHIKGHEMLGWDKFWEHDESDNVSEYDFRSLTSYLCDVCGASQPTNVCALAVDLAKYNNMTMGELFSKYEG
jgi:hypothetical protein